MGKDMEKVFMNGKMEQNMRDHSKTINFMDSVSCNMPMEKNIVVNGIMEKWKELVISFGQISSHIKDNIKTVKKMG